MAEEIESFDGAPLSDYLQDQLGIPEGEAVEAEVYLYETLAIFLSEVKAQKIAVRLRNQAHAGSMAVGFHKFLTRRLESILHGRRRRRLRIAHAGVVPGPALDAAMDRLPSLIPPVFVSKVREWLLHGFTDFIRTSSQKFLAASEDPSDGVTLAFTIEHPPGLKELGQALLEKTSVARPIAEGIGKGSQPIIRVEALPGRKSD